MAEDTYNGWTNYPTWTVYNWLSSDEATNGSIEAIATEAPTVYRAADQMKDYVASRNPLAEGASMYIDLLNFAIGLVNWDEIAEAYWQSTHEQPPERS
jgi:hypothetical protein